VLIEDVTTKGGSVIQAVNAVQAQIITIVDRLEGAEENLRKEGLVLPPIFTTKESARVGGASRIVGIITKKHQGRPGATLKKMRSRLKLTARSRPGRP
jgi:orotate phosphoribosyltransferase